MQEDNEAYNSIITKARPKRTKILRPETQEYDYEYDETEDLEQEDYDE